MHCVRKIKEDLYWVGAEDRRLALFENLFPIPQGVDYNSYLITGEKTVLLDTVDYSVGRQFLENIKPDHCSLIEELTYKYPQMKIICNAPTVKMLKQFYNFDVDSKIEIVKEGDTFITGKYEFQFIMAPMVHWPEVMVTYEKTEKTLFSADAFGSFGALNGKLFNDDIDIEKDWLPDARRYYTNIVGKYGAQVQALLKKAATLDIQKICPLHGPILTEDLGHYIEKYDIWSSYKPEKDGVLVAYNSIHGNTKEAVLELEKILKENGAKKVVLSDLSRDDMAETIEDAFKYDKLIIASPTYDAGLFPTTEKFLRHLKHKNYQNRKIALIENGSWAPMAAKCMKEIISELKDITLVEKVVTIKTKMTEENRKEMIELAKEILI